jgi:hypothetical protein
VSEKLSMPEPGATASVAVDYGSGSYGYPALSGRTHVLAEARVRHSKQISDMA